MLYCEICGQKIRGTAYRVAVGEAMVIACARCASMAKKKWPLSRSPQVGGVPRRKPRQLRSIVEEAPDEEIVVPDYAAIIRKARESLGLTQEQLGRMINEKPSVIRRIESGAMVPTPTVARKLERALKVRILARE